MKKLLYIMFLAVVYSQIAFAQNPSTSQNYVTEKTVRAAGHKTVESLAGLPVDSVNSSIRYFDGLGRPLQTVQWQGSPGKRDLVIPVGYDAFGREDKKYLPYPATAATSNGSYKASGISDQNSFYTAPGNGTWNSPGVLAISGAAFSQTVFEASPLDRVLEQGAPGAVWQPGTRTATSGRSVLIGYGTNNSSTAYSTTGFAVRRYSAATVTAAGHEHERVLGVSGYYGAGQLYLNISKDENWLPADGKVGTSEEYKDREGRVVLKRVFNLGASAVQVLSTYYVYDDFGNLSFVLTAGASPDGTALPDQGELDLVCYQYRYDGRRRLIEKKLPGKGWENIVYNKLDQVVFTQDALQAATPAPGPYRNFIKYDGLGRVIMTGVEKGHLNSRQALQDIVNENPIMESRDNSPVNGYTNIAVPTNLANMEIMELNYYDDYTAPGIPDNQSAGYSNKTKGLLTATKTLVLGTGNYLWTVNYYDEEGRIARSWQQHYKGGVTAANSYDQTSFTYNFAGEVVSSTRKHYVAGVQKLYVYNEYGYDHMGRKISTRQRTGDSDATANPLVYLSKNTYNEIGQQLEKGLHSTDNGASFAQTVRYRYNPRGWLSSQAAPLFTQELKYELDSTGLVAQYNGNISQQKWGTATLVNKKYTYTYDRMNRLLSALSHDGNDETIAYSGMGNITSLQRKSLTATVDQLSYSYTGHRLNGVGDANANTSGSFQLPGSTAYTYDVNGNMKSRINTVNLGNNLKTITYNWLNLPESMNANGALITYTYDANGNKLKKLVSGTVNLNNEYISGIQYEDGDLKYVATETGRVRRISATSYSYEHTLTDHLGNGRVYFDISGGAAGKIQETDYYAFGLDIQRNLVGVENKFQYNGKEKQDHEKLYDYGARFYDPVIGRWNVIDPMAEKFTSSTPYNYVDNNPVLRIDPNGMEGTSTHTDRFGKVLAVYDDGDLGVYKHNDGKLNNYSSANTSGGGAWMGETPYWDEFASHDANGNILGDKNGNFANTNAKLNFGVSADESMSNKIAFASNKINSFGSAFGAKDWLQKNSSRGESLDIKDKVGAENGYLFKGKYVSGESLGNYLFGSNLESLRSFSNLDNLRYPFTNQESVFYRAAEAFGAYHNKSNKVNNPSIKPYYGEIPYSGRQVTLGYYNNNTNNAVFKGYPTTAIYGNKLVR
jgi:RHS repeat-associated protein